MQEAILAVALQKGVSTVQSSVKKKRLC